MSRKAWAGLFGLAGAGFAVTLVTTTAPISATSLPAVTECTATVDGPVQRRTEPASVSAKLSEPLEGTITASVAEDSKVMVVSAMRNDETGAVNLTLRTGEAVIGDWDLTVRNDGGASCTGKLRVVDSPER